MGDSGFGTGPRLASDHFSTDFQSSVQAAGCGAPRARVGRAGEGETGDSGFGTGPRLASDHFSTDFQSLVQAAEPFLQILRIDSFISASDSTFL